MSLVERTLWYLESNFLREVTLEEVAAFGRVSKHHMARAFGNATGYSVMGYVRARRLSEAAHALANGAPDILGVALDVGYGSHEAFTRAFRNQFGVTPDAVRGGCPLADLNLLEPMTMDDAPFADLDPPRFERTGPWTVAGLTERFTWESCAGIPTLWQRFQPYIGAVPRQLGNTAYGVCAAPREDGTFDYLAGVQVSHPADVPADLTVIRLPAARYAVFLHRDHVSAIQRTAGAIWNEWLPKSGYEAVPAPTFERYGDAFDPATGHGGVEIWIPIGD